MQDKKFSLQEALKYGFSATMEHAQLLLGVYGFLLLFQASKILLFWLVYHNLPFTNLSEFSSFLLSSKNPAVQYVNNKPIITQAGLIFSVLNAIRAFVYVALYLGFIQISLDIYDKDKSSFATLFSRWRLLLRSIGATILMGLATVAGLICLIIPGLWIAARLALFMEVLVDTNTGVINSLKRSFAITRGVALKLFACGLVTTLINMLSVVGFVVTIPPMMLAWTYIYRQLDKQA